MFHQHLLTSQLIAKANAHITAGLQRIAIERHQFHPSRDLIKRHIVNVGKSQRDHHAGFPRSYCAHGGSAESGGCQAIKCGWRAAAKQMAQHDCSGVLAGSVTQHLSNPRADTAKPLNPTIGGDGTLTIANALHESGLVVIGVPKTINNDLDKTNTTFGFDTAVSFATECIDRLHSTAQSHHRVIVVEVMGRYAGWIALHSGIAADAHCILIPEIQVDLERVVEKINEREAYGRLYSIVVVAEGTTINGKGRSLAAVASLAGSG